MLRLAQDLVREMEGANPQGLTRNELMRKKTIVKEILMEDMSVVPEKMVVTDELRDHVFAEYQRRPPL